MMVVFSDAVRVPLPRPLLTTRVCATKLPRSNRRWWKHGGHVTSLVAPNHGSSETRRACGPKCLRWTPCHPRSHVRACSSQIRDRTAHMSSGGNHEQKQVTRRRRTISAIPLTDYRRLPVADAADGAHVLEHARHYRCVSIFG